MLIFGFKKFVRGWSLNNNSCLKYSLLSCYAFFTTSIVYKNTYNIYCCAVFRNTGLMTTRSELLMELLNTRSKLKTFLQKLRAKKSTYMLVQGQPRLCNFAIVTTDDYVKLKQHVLRFQDVRVTISDSHTAFKFVKDTCVRR